MAAAGAALLFALLMVGAAPPAAGAGDAENGSRLFSLCATCHGFEPTSRSLGPSLAGVIGRPAATQPGFRYSPALRQSGIVWDAPALTRFLADPAAAVPGNRMPFVGIREPAEIDDVIAYLMRAGGAR
jgi:cytochrome c2